MPKEKSSLSKALKKTAELVAPIVEDGSMLRINVLHRDKDYDPPREQVYGYAAIYVNSRWYLTGYSRLLAAEYLTTHHLMVDVAKYPGTTIELVTEFDTIR